jgi:hypothetical protein
METSIILHGNIYFAVEKGILSPNQLFHHVLSHPTLYLTEQLIPTLILLLRKIVTSQLYHEGKHLLSYFNDDFILRYYFLKGGADVPTHKSNPRLTLKGQLVQTIPTIQELILAENLNDEDTLKYLMDTKLISSELISLIYQTQCSVMMNALTHYKLITVQQSHEYLIQHDYPNLLPIFYDKELYPLMLKRLSYVKEHLPQSYYQKLVQAYYDKWLDDPIFCQNIEEDDLQETIEVFKSQLQIQQLTIPEFYYRFFLYPIPYRCYLLGFNPCLDVPSHSTLLQEYKQLISMDVNDFIETKLKKETPTLDIVNPQDTMLEDPESYLPFDRLDFEDGDKVYRFTRAEFNTIIQTENNLWTNKKLPSHILYSLCNRVTIADYYKLPPACPYEELMEKALTGSLIPKDMMESITQIQSSTSIQDMTG